MKQRSAPEKNISPAQSKADGPRAGATNEAAAQQPDLATRVQGLEAELRNREYEIDLLKEIGAAVVSELNLDKVFDLVANRARDIIHAETLLIALLDEGCGHYTYRAGSGKNAAEIVGETLPLEMGVCGWVWRNKRAWWRGMLHELDAQERNHWESEAGHLILVPLVGKRHFLGGLAGIDKIGGGDFDKRDIDLLTLFANQVAIAIENATLFAGMEQAQRLADSSQLQLAQINSTLEHRVSRRTAELAEANTELQARADALRREKEEQQQLNRRLQEAHAQLLQAEKMASIGQLAAGVAHEINNPVGYVHANLGSLAHHLEGLLRLVDAYESSEALLAGAAGPLDAITQIKRDIELDYMRDDLPTLLHESREGVSRVRQIVQDLKDFSHVDAAEWQYADLHHGLQSTLNIVSSELKFKADVVQELGELPLVECIPSQLNQVFMNLLVNAAQAMDSRGVITLRSGCAADEVWIQVADNGSGIAPELQPRIFDPFFTTKPIGKGTGLGLSLSYGIVRKHGGRIDLLSTPGQGTTFTISLPIKQPAAARSNDTAPISKTA
ncbi:MAG: ATP-binding protein [Gammaproteobacteria bacterium]